MQGMRCIIAGGREFSDYNLVKRKCGAILHKYIDRMIIISGRCDDYKRGVHTFTTDDGIKVYGADGFGRTICQRKLHKVYPYPADWGQYGNAGGPIRNEEMAKNATHLIAFWNGKSRGTKGMIDLAKQYDLQSRIILY